jgi:zinc protease
LPPMQLRSLLLVALTLLAVRPAEASSYAERVKEKTLPNGLKVIVLEDHKAPVAVIQVWYRVGARNEVPGYTGLSHLLEHLMFKGTDKVGPEEYSRLVQKNGGNDNAFTSQDTTVYFASIASDRLPIVIDLEADRMQNLRLTQETFEPERAVVAEERRLRTEDNPTSALFEAISAAAFAAHPYGFPVIGWMADIQSATVDDAIAHYKAFYRPSNAFVVIAGDVDADDIFQRVEKAFGDLPSEPPPRPMRSVEPEQKGERRVSLRKEAELPVVGISYHVPNASHPDSAALEVLASVLSDGESSRLYRDLVYKKQLARSVGASYDRESKDPGLFTLYGQPLPGKKEADLEKEILAEVEAVKAKPVEARELEKVKNSVEADLVFAQDSLFYQAMLIGQYETLGDWRQLDQILPAVRAVTAADVQRVARHYLTAENRTVGVLEPWPMTGKRRPPAPAAPGGMVR